MLGYRVPAPDEAMLISGGKQKAEGGGQFRIVTGHGAWVMPFFRKVRFLSLEIHRVEFQESCFTTDGITVNISAVVAFKVDNSPTAITAAAHRFLNDQKKGQMEDLTVKIFVGHLRGIIGRMTIEQIIREREHMNNEVLEGSQNEMSSMGLHVDSMQIETFNDGQSGYIANMAKPKMAALEQQANIAQAQADQASQAAQQQSLRQQAEQQRDTALAQARFKAEMDRAAAEAAQAGPLASAEHQQEVIDMQTQMAQRNAILREQQLIADVIKPAEASARQLRIDADAEASAAEAAAKQAEWEATGEATRRVKAAEAAAQETKVRASANAEAATANATATREQGQADAAAAQAKALADAAGIEAKGLAEGAGLLARAQAAAAGEGAQLKMRAIEIQPEIARALAEGINIGGAKNLTVLNGAQGLEQLVGVGFTLLQEFLTRFNAAPDLTTPAPPDPAANGVPAQPVAQHF